MKLVAAMIALLITFSASAAPGQTSSQEEFKDLCTALHGRWVSVISMPVDYPGLAKKGEQVTAYVDFRLTADGSALLGTAYSGDGAVTVLTMYDPVAGKINPIFPRHPRT